MVSETNHKINHRSSILQFSYLGVGGGAVFVEQLKSGEGSTSLDEMSCIQSYILLQHHCSLQEKEVSELPMSSEGFTVLPSHPEKFQ